MPARPPEGLARPVRSRRVGDIASAVSTSSWLEVRHGAGRASCPTISRTTRSRSRDPQAAQAAGQDQQDDQHADAGRQQLPFSRRDEPAGAAQVQRAQERTTQRAETTDDGRDEHVEALAGAVAGDDERLVEVRVQRTTDAGHAHPR